MKTNKSIDGLVTRDAKNPALVVKPPKKTTKRSSESVTGIVKSQKTTPKPVKTTSATKPTKTTKIPVQPKPTTISKSERTIELIESIKEEPIHIKGAPSDDLEILTTDDLTQKKPEDQEELKETDESSNIDNITISVEESQSESPSEREQITADFLSPVQAFDFTEGGELTASKTPIKTMNKSHNKSEPSHQKSEKKKPASKTRKVVIIVLLFIILGLIGAVLWLVFWGNDIIAKITGGQGNVFDLITLNSETYEPLKTDSNGRTNILAFGTSGFDMDGTDGDGTHDGSQLTDSIMAISLKQNTGDIAMISIPRDLKVPGACYAGKINEVYVCNSDNGKDDAAGATALMSEVGTVLGIDFQYYAHLNWGSLVSIVDTLGGIKVTLDEDINDTGWTDAVYTAGVEYFLNGEEALGLARARHGTVGGDFTRGTSQQKILIGIKDRVFEKNLSIGDLISLASTLGDNLRTNFSVSDLKTLAHLTYDFDLDSMRQIALIDYINGIYYMTTGTIGGISYVLPSAGVGNYEEVQEFIATQLSNDPRSYEEPTILVLNASETVGIASSERAKLETEGWTKVTTDNAPEGEYTPGTTLYFINEKPGSKSLIEKYYNTSAIPADNLPAGISKDYDFVVILNPTDN